MAAILIFDKLRGAYFSSFSHFWFATPQLVLQADWQEVWHSPHPPFLALSQREAVFKVLILFIMRFSNLIMYYFIIKSRLNQWLFRHIAHVAQPEAAVELDQRLYGLGVCDRRRTLLICYDTQQVGKTCIGLGS